MGYKKYRFLLQRAHPCVNPCRFSHFASASKLVRGSDLQACYWKVIGQSESHSSVPPTGKSETMSPLKRSLNYRSACDYNPPKLSIRIVLHTIMLTSSNVSNYQLVLGDT